MDYQLIKTGDAALNLPITLTMAEVKFLSNATQHMIKISKDDKNATMQKIYEDLLQELQDIIDYQQNKLNP